MAMSCSRPEMQFSQLLLIIICWLILPESTDEMDCYTGIGLLPRQKLIHGGKGATLDASGYTV
jgi:hypothetical protein